MRQPPPIKRYALAHSGNPAPRPNEGVRRLRLLRMEEIAAAERAQEPPQRPERSQP